MEAAAELLEHVAGELGGFVERKGATLTVHSREAPDPVRAATELTSRATAVAHDTGLVTRPARMAIELRPPLPFDKGSAVRALLRARPCDRSLYAGDDVTDIDTFAVVDVSVAVVSAEAPAGLVEAATFSVTDAGELLSRLNEPEVLLERPRLAARDLEHGAVPVAQLDDPAPRVGELEPNDLLEVDEVPAMDAEEARRGQDVLELAHRLARLQQLVVGRDPEVRRSPRPSRRPRVEQHRRAVAGDRHLDDRRPRECGRAGRGAPTAGARSCGRAAPPRRASAGSRSRRPSTPAPRNPRARSRTPRAGSSARRRARGPRRCPSARASRCRRRRRRSRGATRARAPRAPTRPRPRPRAVCALEQVAQLGACRGLVVDDQREQAHPHQLDLCSCGIVGNTIETSVPSRGAETTRSRPSSP